MNSECKTLYLDKLEFILNNVDTLDIVFCVYNKLKKKLYIDKNI